MVAGLQVLTSLKMTGGREGEATEPEGEKQHEKGSRDEEFMGKVNAEAEVI